MRPDLGWEVTWELFEPEALRRLGVLTGTARGRGTTLFLRWHGTELVLRHYRRGGLVGRVLADRYCGCGLARSRPWREWVLLATLAARGLPVPLPVAARVHQGPFWYRGDLVTERLAATVSLAERLGTQPLPAELWRAIGACIARFHAHGAWHADLNAHNILLGADGRVFLIDWDRGTLSAPGGWAVGNLARLHRSLAKLSRLRQPFEFRPADWVELLEGYHAAPAR